MWQRNFCEDEFVVCEELIKKIIIKECFLREKLYFCERNINCPKRTQNRNSMWATEISRQTTATKEQVWKLWADVTHWNTWDSTVKSSELYGDFKTGTKGVVKLMGPPKSTFVITNCEPFKSFTNTSYLPLCKVDFTLVLDETPNGLLVTYRQEMTGFLTFFFSKVMGKMMTKGLSKGMDDLIKHAEKLDCKSNI